MKSKWFVSLQKITGGYMYIAMRVKNISEIVHSGNIETFGSYSANRKAIEKLVAELNEKESEER